jgi:hypothetical protein
MSFALLALDPKRRGIQRERKILEHSRILARRQIERDDPRDARAIGIDGDGIDRRVGGHLRRAHRAGDKRREHGEARRQKNVRNQSHGYSPEPVA